MHPQRNLLASADAEAANHHEVFSCEAKKRRIAHTEGKISKGGEARVGRNQSEILGGSVHPNINAPGPWIFVNREEKHPLQGKIIVVEEGLVEAVFDFRFGYRDQGLGEQDFRPRQPRMIRLRA